MPHYCWHVTVSVIVLHSSTSSLPTLTSKRVAEHVLLSTFVSSFSERLNKNSTIGLIHHHMAEDLIDNSLQIHVLTFIKIMHPSGYYWLNAGLQPKQVYCSINENPCCNDSDAKWMRIAYLNMSHPTAQCPHPWRELDSPIRTCRRQFNTSISSVNYSSYGIPYSTVCGRIIAYQFGSPEAFSGYIYQNQTTIDKPYVDGISITYGKHPRNHIWTFAAAKSNFHNCPCTSGITTALPPFINEDYFCEHGSEDSNYYKLGLIADNPLWDGHGCTGSSTCCEFNNPPWFCKQLPEPTTEDIEIRICGNVNSRNFLEEEDTPVQLIEIYVQ